MNIEEIENYIDEMKKLISTPVETRLLDFAKLLHRQNQEVWELYNRTVPLIVAERDKYKEALQKVKGASYRGENYALECIEKLLPVDADKVISEFVHIHDIAQSALKEE